MAITNFSTFDTSKVFSKKAFKNLTKVDTTALSVFLVYMLGKIPDYATVSSLLLLTNEEYFLELLKIFGGKTITFPTIEDMTTALAAIKLYSLVKIDNLKFEEACICTNATAEVKEAYNKLDKILNDNQVMLSSNNG